MVQQVTQGIKISVKTKFDGTYYKDRVMLYAFSYMVTIENQSKDTVQLTSRSWIIKDSLNGIESIEGEGVIGQKPVLAPGKKYAYTSSALLFSPFGAMKGYFNMVNFTTTSDFRVSIPLFNLSAPFSTN
ncbi:Co2+/Mg2+ efflux protein ApaG [Aequorivita sp. SDUM287046]|uniref:Co2+/Mg2+ efflux protein ApaG n=1 Tax=Aequorivita aurantiaca TaxID=3053356 RepID=A0ABT8DEC6_9FLAO|nr:Co2+/Mg2+ efflux protein ApaG [Aequorivita aurantiaca]MDN3723646.1 Co2+/Mg2+ efflux protein ApaG [Aequorivita aurantiaca]